MNRLLFAMLCGLLGAFGSLVAEDYVVGQVPDDIREKLKLEEFYQKQTAVAGFSIVSSAKVSDHALKEAAWILEHMMAGRTDILEAMTAKNVRLTVMAWNEYTTDVPEHRHLKPRVFWDRRARGLGGSPVSCGEENLLDFPNDPYSTENLLIHEFAHAVHGFGLKAVDPTFDDRLQAAYRKAMDRGLWKGTYAGSNRGEYWAEAVQDWFDDNRQNDALHNHVNTRAELKEYDPDLAALCAEVFGDKSWRYLKPKKRPPEQRKHLADLNLSSAPRFQWRNETVPDQARVLIQTEIGDIEVELDRRKAPVTVTNFLRYVHEGYYSDGLFFRTVTLDNQPTNKIKIEVIQSRADPAKEKEFPPSIPLERTRDTGLRHLDGTISMARAEPDSAQDHFFICIGDQPELDFGGKRNPDGQGFAAFGKVTKGMDIVRKIQSSKAEGQNLTPSIRIQRAVRLN